MSGRGPLPRRRRMRLRTKLIAVSLLLLLAFVGAGIAAVSYVALDTYLTGQLDQQLRRSAQSATAPNPAPGQLPGGSGTTPPNPLRAPGQGEGILMLRVADRAVDTARSGWIDLQYQQHQIASDDVAKLKALTAGAAPSNVDLGVGAYRAESMEASDGSIVTVGLPLGALNDTLSSLGLTMALVAAAGLVAAGVAGTVLIRHNLKPLEHVSAVANRVAELHLDSGDVDLMERIEPSDNDTEVGRVGFALNRMLDNVAGALDARQESESKVRRFVADASHELRTPLASIRGYSDLVVRTQHLDDGGRDSMDRVRSQALRMQNLVDDLLLARYDEGRELALDELDLTQLVVEAATDAEISDAAASARTGTPAHRWNIDIAGGEIMVRGDEGQLHRAVANLLSNARKHTDPGTPVSVFLAPLPGGGAVVKVSDAGRGIDAEFLPRIFDRFARADSARSGTEGTTGLGLPIVKAIVESHGGSIAVASSPTGTQFTMSLPAAEERA